MSATWSVDAAAKITSLWVRWFALECVRRSPAGFDAPVIVGWP